jgi:hypothetical protein
VLVGSNGGGDNLSVELRLVLVKKLSAHREAGKKAARTPRSRAAASEAVKIPLVHWADEERLDNLGHGVQFLHEELQRVVAFLEGFEWLRPGTSATVRLLRSCPTSITADHWSEIIQNTREAVLVYLNKVYLNEGDLNYSFRHGPIEIQING